MVRCGYIRIRTFDTSLVGTHTTYFLPLSVPDLNVPCCTDAVPIARAQRHVLAIAFSNRLRDVGRLHCRNKKRKTTCTSRETSILGNTAMASAFGNVDYWSKITGLLAGRRQKRSRLRAAFLPVRLLRSLSGTTDIVSHRLSFTCRLLWLRPLRR